MSLSGNSNKIKSHAWCPSNLIDPTRRTGGHGVLILGKENWHTKDVLKFYVCNLMLLRFPPSFKSHYAIMNYICISQEGGPDIITTTQLFQFWPKKRCAKTSFHQHGPCTPMMASIYDSYVVVISGCCLV